MTSPFAIPGLRAKIFRFPFIPLAVTLFMVVRLLTTGLGWFGLTVLAFSSAFFGVELVRWLFGFRYEMEERDPARQIVREEPENLISLVFFLDEPRAVKEESLRKCVKNAIGIDVEKADGKDDFFVVQYRPPTMGSSNFIDNFMIRIPQGVFSVMSSSRPYISNPVRFARDSIRDKRLRTAVEKHRAWISVDLMDDQLNSKTLAYQVIGKLMAAMAGPDCLAIYCPEIQRCNEFEPSQIELLCGNTPLSLFSEPTFEPVIEVADDDPRMAAAEQLAKKLWPEFVQAFARRKPADAEKYIIKAEFSEGLRSEYMWVTVTRIENAKIHGVLTNDPHELVEVFRGARVEVPLDRLNDWIYPGEDGKAVGGFTLDILNEDL